jgi:hypothetical protein
VRREADPSRVAAVQLSTFRHAFVLLSLLVRQLQFVAGHRPAGRHRPRERFYARSLKRWILPVAVFGRLSRNSIQRGYW